ncbi:MAG: nitrogen regulation protein NR(II) [Thiotrichales bacterium]
MRSNARVAFVAGLQNHGDHASTARASPKMSTNLTNMPEWAVVGLSMSVAALILLVLYRLGLSRLHQRILDAREGLLEPARTSGLVPPFVRRVVNDYNITIATLRSMFRTVEECQSRVLDERNKINAILRSLPDVLLSVADDLDITMVNSQAEEMFGRASERLLGTNLFDLIAFNENDRNLMRDAFLYKTPIRNQEVALTLEGKTRWFSLNLGFVSDRDADMGAIITLLDITDYRELQSSVATREKLVAMGQLAAGVAHELNTPLGNILGYAQLIQSNLGNPEKLAGFADVVVGETKRCSRVVQELLNFARSEKCSGATCDIKRMLEELIETFLNCRMKRYGIAIDLQLEAEGLMVEGDCGQLDIVFSNLLLNAIQALEGVEHPRILVHSWDEPGRYVHVAIEDNGPGVPKEMRSRIFEPFFTTKDVGSGSGLGLSISHALLAKRGGRIRLDPEYEAGARFVVSLPVVDPRRLST